METTSIPPFKKPTKGDLIALHVEGSLSVKEVLEATNGRITMLLHVGKGMAFGYVLDGDLLPEPEYFYRKVSYNNEGPHFTLQGRRYFITTIHLAKGE